jgi:hypothetical protein
MVFGLEMIFNWVGSRISQTDTCAAAPFWPCQGFCIKGVVGSMGWLAGREGVRSGPLCPRQPGCSRYQTGLSSARNKEAWAVYCKGGQATTDALPGQNAFIHPTHMLLVTSSRPSPWFATHPPLAEQFAGRYGRPVITTLQPG